MNIHEKLIHTQFLQRENYRSHHKYDEEMLQYEYIKNGDNSAIDLALKSFLSKANGHLSDNPLRNAQYMFVCSMTLVTRFVIEGGMDPETAYNTSDIYIQSVDRCKAVEEVKIIHKDMVVYFVKQMAKLKKQGVFSKPIILSIEYIYANLHHVIKLSELAKEVKINESYLSTLFKKEMGLSVSEYIRKKKVEAGENMIKYSNNNLIQISEYLAFSSYSHFADVFKKYTGYTPKQYQRKFFRKTVLVD